MKLVLEPIQILGKFYVSATLTTTMKTTIATLKAALPKGSHIEEDTNETGGTISIYAPDWQEWTDLGTNSACAEYYDYDEWEATRADAIRFLLEVPSGGLTKASADTIHAMGW